MSFRCGLCNEVSELGVAAIRVVVERRTKIYELGGGETVEGSETVREVLAHASCALKVSTPQFDGIEGAKMADVWSDVEAAPAPKPKRGKKAKKIEEAN